MAHKVMVRRLLKCTDAATYRWWQLHMDTPFLDGIWQLAKSSGDGLTQVTSKAGKAVVDGVMTPRLAFSYLALHNAYCTIDREETIGEGVAACGGEELLVEAMVDFMLEDTEASRHRWARLQASVNHWDPPQWALEHVMSYLPRLALKALGIFSKQVGDCPRRTEKFGHVMPTLLTALFDPKHKHRQQVAGPDGQHEGIESISALRALYIEKQKEGKPSKWVPLGDDGVEQVVQLL